MAELVNNLDTYISLGRISAEDAQMLRKSRQVDAAIRAGKIDEAQGGKIRESFMSGEARERIEKGVVKEVLDFAVAYQQVFEALARIDPDFDPGLRFLARHGGVINEDSDAGVPAGLGPVVEALMGDPESLRPLIDLMDRKETEARMIARRRPC